MTKDDEDPDIWNLDDGFFTPIPILFPLKYMPLPDIMNGGLLDIDGYDIWDDPDTTFLEFI